MKKGIVAVISSIVGAAIGMIVAGKLIGKSGTDKQTMSDKHLALYLLMNQWVKVKQQGKSIPQYLLQKGYKKIAIYGMNYVGETLFDELNNSEIEIAYAIDKNAEGIYAEVDMFSPDDTLPEADAVIVTPVFFFDEIEELLSTKTEADIISLEDILYGI